MSGGAGWRQQEECDQEQFEEEETMDNETKVTGLALLRKAFPENQISKLPKPYKSDSPKGNCKECGGYHGLPALHLDYVGHAALTDRLLDVDPLWSWEPLSLDATGLPALDKDGGMWIKLTVLGVTRLGYGDAQGKTGGNAAKERIGDALRNAAMRFGAALDLWHKGDLRAHEEDVPAVENEKPKSMSKSAIADHLAAIESAGDMEALFQTFTAAYKAAQILQDANAEKEFQIAKDKRKDILSQLAEQA